MLRSLQLQNFGNHRKTSLSFHEPGLHVFVGGNGAGKSLLGEAIYWALYGRSIRSTSGWRAGGKGVTRVRLELDAPELCVERVWNGKATKLITEPAESTHVRRVEAYLQDVFGTFRRATSTSVFHRALMSRFATATETERKVLIEELLELDVCEEVSKALRKELAEAKAELENAGAVLNACARKAEWWRGALSSMERPRLDPDALDTIRGLQADLEALGTHPAPSPPNRGDLDALLAAAARAETRSGLAHSALIEAKTAVAGGRCYACGQAIEGKTDVSIPSYEEEAKSAGCVVRDARAALFAEQERNRKALESYTRRRAEYDRALLRWTELEATLATKKQQVADCAQAKAAYGEKLRHSQAELATATAALDSASRAVREAQSRVDRIQDLRRIFGPRGARTLALTRAFEAVSSEASRVLRTIYSEHDEHPEASVSLDIADTLSSVSVNVQFGDRELPYACLSEGEKPAVDFSILKALAAVPRGSRVSLPLIYDDVFDALDSDVRGQVASFIEAESRDRLVLVFTHDDRVLPLFEAPHIHAVSGGNVTSL